MSIATEITRLQGIKADIRTALVTQGIAQASSHNMADFSADILAIQGGSEGVYITVKCEVDYQGYDIILSANESELDRKQCPSSLIVNFFVSADNVTLPATFTISNSLNNITTDITATMYGWYETSLYYRLYLLKDGIISTSLIGNLNGIKQESAFYSIDQNGIKYGLKSENYVYFNAYFDKQIDVTRFSNLHFTLSNNNELKCQFGLETNAPSSHNTSLTYYKDSINQSVDIDLSNVTGLHYLAFSHNSAPHIVSTNYITEIYLST